MVFAENQEQNEFYNFRDMLLQLDNPYFILAMIKEVELNKDRRYWTLIKNSEVNNKHKNNDGNLKTIRPVWSFKLKILPHGR